MVLTISCNLLKTVLKVKNSMVVWVQSGCKCISYLPWVYDWRGTATHCHGPASQRFMRSKFRVQFLLNVYSFCSIIKLKNVDWTIVNQGSSVLYSWASVSVDSTNSGLEIFGGKIPGSSKKQNLNLQHWQLFT